MRLINFLIFTCFILSCCNSKEIEKPTHEIRALILSGKNNHEWEKTTLQLVKMYDFSGRFITQVTESPDTLIYEDFIQFDVVVSNWSAWPEHDYRWPKATEDGLIKYIEEGGGLVVFHAASATFYDWPEYQELVGTTWGDSTRHGKITPHKIVFKDHTHPITKGIADFWITDELWVNAGVNAELYVLAESYSDPSNSGTGKMEPVIHIKEVGKGRVFHNILGHNVRAMKNSGWTTLMLRGTEWAATGEVSIPVPGNLRTDIPGREENFSWETTDSTATLLNHDEIVWQYNFNTIKGKPFFHPVNVNGSTLTWLSPEDHPWHLGIWHSWKFINGVNYWEYDMSKGVAPFNFLGITEVRNITVERVEDFSANFNLEIYYHEKNGPDLLKELRKINVSAPNKKGEFSISYEMHYEALSDSVELNRTPLPHEENGKSWGGYAGLSARFSQDMFDPKFINSDGSTDMKHGEPMSWKYYGLRSLKGDQLGVGFFTDKRNLNHPEPWFMTRSEDHPFYYLSPAPIFNQPHILHKGQKLTFGYQLKIYAGQANYSELESDYKNYLKNIE